MSDTNTKSPDQAERDVAEARTDLEGSLSALERRLSPEALLDQGLAYMRGDGRRHVTSLARQAEANPLPLVLIGIGVAWLAIGSRQPIPGRPAERRPEPRLDHRPTYATDGEPDLPDHARSATPVATPRVSETPAPAPGSTTTTSTLKPAPASPPPPTGAGLATGGARAEPTPDPITSAHSLKNEEARDGRVT